jgi:hypothetical protein
MRTTVVILQWIVRLCFVGLLILGITFWTGHAFDLVPLHMSLGIALVVGLWITAILGFAARVPIGQSLVAIVWGFVVIGLGMSQMRLLPGSSHWVIQVLHLLVGMTAIGMNEGLVRAIKARGSEQT